MSDFAKTAAFRITRSLELRLESDAVAVQRVERWGGNVDVPIVRPALPSPITPVSRTGTSLPRVLRGTHRVPQFRPNPDSFVPNCSDSMFRRKIDRAWLLRLGLTALSLLVLTAGWFPERWHETGEPQFSYMKHA